MWYYQIVSKYGDCLEGGTFRNKEEMCRYCERRMKQLNAHTWTAEYSEEVEDELSKQGDNMNKETMIEILKFAGYTETAAKKGIELGTVIMDNLEDFERELPGVDPEIAEYNGVKYYIDYAG